MIAILLAVLLPLQPRLYSSRGLAPSDRTYRLSAQAISASLPSYGYLGTQSETIHGSVTVARLSRFHNNTLFIHQRQIDSPPRNEEVAAFRDSLRRYFHHLHLQYRLPISSWRKRLASALEAVLAFSMRMAGLSDNVPLLLIRNQACLILSLRSMNL